MGGVIGLAAEGEGLAVPREREFAGGEEAREDAVGGGVAPEDEVFAGEVGVGEGGVVFHGGVAAEDVAPQLGGVGEFGGGPRADVGVEGLAGGTDEDEGLQEGVVDRAGEAGRLAERGVD